VNIHSIAPPEPPRTWRDPLLLLYPHGMTARFDPRGRFLRPGDLVNGYQLDHFEVDGLEVVAVLRRSSPS
jgi:hypothetical protein